MRKLLLIVLTAMMSLALNAQTTLGYEVFALSGETAYLASGAWNPLAKLTPLSATSRIKVGENSSLTVREKKSGALYVFKTPTDSRLGILVAQENKRKDGIVKQVNAYVQQQMKDSAGETNRDQMAVVGGTSRGKQIEAITDSVYYALRRAIDLVGQDRDIVTPGVSLALVDAETKEPLSKTALSSGAPYYFRITNDSSIPLCVNVLRIVDGAAPELCFDLGYTYDEPYLLVMAGQTLDVEQYVFAGVGAKSTYVLFASPRTFDTRQLKRLLSGNAVVRDADGIHMFFAIIQ